MGIEFNYIKKEHHLEFTLQGEFNQADLKMFISESKQIADLNKTSKILVDTTKTSKDNITNLDRFGLGIELSKIYTVHYKIGVLEKKQYINKFTETTARNRMIQIYVHHVRNELLEWLVR